MRPVDLTSAIEFQTQFSTLFGETKQMQNVACAKACKHMLTHQGYGVTDATKRIDVATLKKDKKTLEKAGTYDSGIALLFANLEAGRPVIIGVNRGPSVGNANPGTTHFVVVVGTIEDHDKKGLRFYDPGTSYPNKGTSEENILWLGEDGLYSGHTKYNSVLTYVLTEVRPTAPKTGK